MSKPTTSPRKRKLDIYIPNPPLDHALTVLFFVELAFVAKILFDEEAQPGDFTSPLGTFIVFLAACAGLIWIVKRSSLWVAGRINTLLLSAKVVEDAPIVGAKQLRKWQDQSWQFVIHVSMMAFEVYLLTYDCPGLWSATELAWVPSPFPPYRPSLLLSRFYLFQLVRFA